MAKLDHRVMELTILKWLGSTFVVGLRRILHHQPMAGYCNGVDDLSHLLNKKEL